MEPLNTLVTPPDSPVDAAVGEPTHTLPPLAHTVLVLEPDNVRNAVLRRFESSTPLYTIRSDARGDRTEVYVHGTELDEDGLGSELDEEAANPPVAPVASIHRKGFTPTLTLHGARMALARWLKASFSTGFPVSFEADGERFEWRLGASDSLALYALSNPALPIAWSARPAPPAKTAHPPMTASTTTAAGAGRRAYLALEPAAERVRDDVVVSFLVVEEMASVMKIRRGRW